MSKHDFVGWLLEDVNAIYAEKGSPREQQLQEFVSEGWLAQADDVSGDSAYIFAPDALSKITETDCPLCRGAGTDPPTNPYGDKCPACHGVGQITG